MAQNYSFDVFSKVDLQEVDNAVNQCLKELRQRYDFKNVKFDVEFQRAHATLTLKAEDDFKLKAVLESLKTKFIKRKVPLKNMDEGKIEAGSGISVRQQISLKQGIPSEASRQMVKLLKEKKLKKVQATIQKDQVRIAASSKDALQEVMALLRAEDFGVDLQFGNYR